MKFLTENLDFGIDEFILLEEALEIIKNRKGKQINLNSKIRKETILKVLNFYNLTYIDKGSDSNNIKIGDHHSKILLEKTKDAIFQYKELFTKRIKTYLDNFFLVNSIPKDSKRLIIIYGFLKEISSLMYNSSLDCKIQAISGNKKKFVFYSTYFDIFIRFLISIYELISKDDIINLSEISKKLDVRKKIIYYFSPIIKIVLNVKDITYFNIIRPDLNFEKNFTQIPKVFQGLVKTFEYNLRYFLVNKLLNHFTLPIQNHFEDFNRHRRMAITEMMRSKESQSMINKFKHSDYANKDDLKWIVDQMYFSDYPKFISRNNFIKCYFKNSTLNLDYENDLRKIAQIRHIDAHNKTQAKRDISKVLDRMYEYECIFKI